MRILKVFLAMVLSVAMILPTIVFAAPASGEQVMGDVPHTLPITMEFNATNEGGALTLDKSNIYLWNQAYDATSAGWDKNYGTTAVVEANSRAWGLGLKLATVPYYFTMSTAIKKTGTPGATTVGMERFVEVSFRKDGTVGYDVNIAKEGVFTGLTWESDVWYEIDLLYDRLNNKVHIAIKNTTTGDVFRKILDGVSSTGTIARVWEGTGADIPITGETHIGYIRVYETQPYGAPSTTWTSTPSNLNGMTITGATVVDDTWTGVMSGTTPPKFVLSGIPKPADNVVKRSLIFDTIGNYRRLIFTDTTTTNANLFAINTYQMTLHSYNPNENYWMVAMGVWNPDHRLRTTLSYNPYETPVKHTVGPRTSTESNGGEFDCINVTFTYTDLDDPSFTPKIATALVPKVFLDYNTITMANANGNIATTGTKNYMGLLGVTVEDYTASDINDVFAVNPTNNQKDVQLDANVNIILKEGATPESYSYELTQGTDAVALNTPAVAGTIVTLDPANNLLPNTTYTIIVKKGTSIVHKSTFTTMKSDVVGKSIYSEKDGVYTVRKPISFTTKGKNAVQVVASYDSSGKMVSCGVDIYTGDTACADLTSSVALGATGTTIKSFIWDSFTSLKPIETFEMILGE